MKYINRFNSPATALVISGYPEKGRRGKNHGIAWYTKQTIKPIAKKFGQKFVVLAEKNHDNAPQLTGNKNILILRVFDRKRTSLYPQILTWLARFSKVKNVYVHSEFGMKGGVWHFALLLPFLAMIKLTGRNITFFSHNVIADIGMLSGHLNITKGSLTHKTLNLGLKAYYKALGLLSDKIVVLDEAIKARLTKFVDEKKVAVLPIPVKKKSLPLTKNKAKKLLDIPSDHKVLLYFGFVTWYKGADKIVNAFNQLSRQGKAKKTHLVIAGGESYSLRDKPYYTRFYDQVQEIANQNDHIHLTGFVPEANIPHYFAAADLVVFPYRGVMGASGSITHALSYEKPFVTSREMSSLLNTPQVKLAKTKAGVSNQDLLFTTTANGLNQLINSAKQKSYLRKLTQFSKVITNLRDTDVSTVAEYQELYSQLGETQLTKAKAIFNK